jgi:hypothetical protein
LISNERLEAFTNYQRDPTGTNRPTPRNSPKNQNERPRQPAEQVIPQQSLP